MGESGLTCIKPRSPRNLILQIASWAFFVGAFFHFKHLILSLGFINDSETRAFLELRTEVVRSFLATHLPAWNPLAGPGGSPAMLVGKIPWDYESILYWLKTDNSWLTFYKFFILITTFVFCFQRIVGARRLSRLGLGFLLYFILDMVPIHIARFGHFSTYVGFLLCLSSIYRIETKPSPKSNWDIFSWDWLIFFFGYVFSFQSTQVVIWVIQFQMMLLLSISILRGESKGKWLDHPKNLFYLSAICLGVVANAWQLSWFASVIQESSRSISPSTFSPSFLLLEFLTSFLKSSHTLFLGFYWGITLLFTPATWRFSKQPSRALLRLLSLVSLFGLVAHQDLHWFKEDSLLFSHLTFSASFGFPVAAILTFLLILKSAPYRNYLKLEFPLLLVTIHYFLFDNAHTFSYGQGPIERIPPYLTTVIPMILFAALWTKQKTLLRYCLWILLSVILLRAHLSILLIRCFGVAWYVQRDAAVIATGLSLLGYLGLGCIHSTITTALRNFRNRFRTGKPIPSRALRLTTGMFFWCLLYGASLGLGVKTFGDEGVWMLFSDPGLEGAAYARILESLPPSQEPPRILALTRRARVTGSLTFLGYQSINMYDSLVSEHSNRFLRPFYHSQNSLPPIQCRVPVVWYPNNMFRTFGCSIEDLHGFYNSNLGNMEFALDSEQLFNQLDIDYLVTTENVDRPFLQKIDLRTTLEEIEKADPWKLNAYPIKLYRYVGHHSSLAELDRGQTSCSEPFRGSPVDIHTNYFQKPVLKRKFRFELQDPGSGCLRLQVAYSPYWKVRVDGQRVFPQLVEGLYLGIPIPEGTKRIEIEYLPQLPALIGVGALTILVGFLLPAMTSIARRKAKLKTKKDAR